jgi:hypothetical protein
MYEGGISATNSVGGMTGVSESVETNSVLGFIALTALFAPEPVENVYCVVVSAEKLGSFVTGLDCVTLGQYQQRHFRSV